LTDDEEESGVVVEVLVSRYSAPAVAGWVEVLVVLAMVVVVVVEAVAVGAVDDGDGIVCRSEPEWDSQLAVLLIINPRGSVAGVKSKGEAEMGMCLRISFEWEEGLRADGKGCSSTGGRRTGKDWLAERCVCRCGGDD
jgi:hypothetical protein